MLLRSFVFSLLLALPHHALAKDTLPTEAPYRITIQNVDGAEVKHFTVEQLKTRFPQHVYETRTPWTSEDGKVVYRGPLLEDVLKQSEVSWDQAVKVIAYDDYASVMPLATIEKLNPILAIETATYEECTHDGCNNENRFQPIEITNKGPILFVWPFEQLENEHPTSAGRFWVFSPVILRVE